jgi:hypothetical protein
MAPVHHKTPSSLREAGRVKDPLTCRSIFAYLDPANQRFPILKSAA